MKKIAIASKKVKDFDYLELAINEFVNEVKLSPKGKFALEYGFDIELMREYNPLFFEHTFTIISQFDEVKVTEFYLRFDNFSV